MSPGIFLLYKVTAKIQKNTIRRKLSVYWPDICINNVYHDFNLFSEEDKRRYRDEHFATDLQNARDLGRRLVEMANKLIV